MVLRDASASKNPTRWALDWGDRDQEWDNEMLIFSWKPFWQFSNKFLFEPIFNLPYDDNSKQSHTSQASSIEEASAVSKSIYFPLNKGEQFFDR